MANYVYKYLRMVDKYQKSITLFVAKSSCRAEIFETLQTYISFAEPFHTERFSDSREKRDASREKRDSSREKRDASREKRDSSREKRDASREKRDERW